MPFTAAHPLAVLPIWKLLTRRAELSALVIGSIAPDLSYFLPLSIGRAQSHSPLGLLWFTLPAALIAYFWFHTLLGPLLDALAPESVRARFRSAAPASALSVSRLGIIVASVLVGALTHLAWDAFTHAEGPAVRKLPLLTTPLLEWEGYTVFVYKVLQHGSSLLGMLGTGWWLRAQWRSVSPNARPRILSKNAKYLLLAGIVVPVLIAGAWAGQCAAVNLPGIMRQLQHFVGAAVFTGGTALLVTMFAASAGFRWFQGKTE